MAIPPFGLTRAEQAATGLLTLSGVAGLVLTMLDREPEPNVAAVLRDVPWRAWLVPTSSKTLLITQSVLVVASALGVLIRSFTLVAVGIIAGLVLVTPVGQLTVIPAVWMLVLVVPRWQSFWEFTPRWRGEGPPPPGHWR